MVIGLGNRVMGDDAAGLDALGRFAELYECPEEVDLLDGGTLGLDLLAHLEGYEGVLVADAVTRGGHPGEVFRIGKDQVHGTFAESLSPHQVGLQDLFAVLELQGRTPERLAVVGVEPQTVELGVGLSPAVGGALDAMAAALAQELAGWGIPVGPKGARGAARPEGAPEPATGPVVPGPGGGPAAPLPRR